MIEPLDVIEKRAILAAIVEREFNVVDAARALDVPYRTVYRALKRWNLDPPATQNVTNIELIRRRRAIESALSALRINILRVILK